MKKINRSIFTNYRREDLNSYGFCMNLKDGRMNSFFLKNNDLIDMWNNRVNRQESVKNRLRLSAFFRLK